jgi:hypothetical protein
MDIDHVCPNCGGFVDEDEELTQCEECGNEICSKCICCDADDYDEARDWWSND